MKTTSRLLVLAAAAFGAHVASAADCLELSVTVKHAVTADASKVLEVVEKQVAANPSCACEIVKAAITSAEADAKLVANIVEVAATAAPDQLRLVSQCAVAVAPDSLNEVQMVMARLEPGSGEPVMSDAKSPKGPIEVKPAWNPLDFPGQGIGPNPGGPGGNPLIPVGPPVTVPPVTVPPVIEPPNGTLIDYNPFPTAL